MLFSGFSIKLVIGLQITVIKKAQKYDFSDAKKDRFPCKCSMHNLKHIYLILKMCMVF